MTRRRDWTLAAASGLLLALAHPPATFLLPALVGLVPLLMALEVQPPGPHGRWTATRAAFLTGLVYFGIQLYWLAVALLQYSVLAIPAYLAAILVLAGLTGAFGWAVHWTRDRLALPLALRAALLWTLLEWVQAHAGDLAFPWLGLGAGLAPFPTLAGAADLVGVRGLTFWLAGINGLGAEIVLRVRAGRPRGAVLATLLVVVALPTAYGVVRARTLSVRPAARVALVQPNIPQRIKQDPRLALDSSLTALTRLTGTLAGERVDLVIWPEVAVPAELDRARIRSIQALGDRIPAPILVGAWGTDSVGNTYNAAFLIRPGTDEASPPRYDKQRLVAFVERVPFIDPALLPARADKSRYGTLERGRERAVMELGSGTRFGTLICFESIFGDLARADRRQGADFIANITNDAWFGRDTWWGRTTALWQHPAHTVLRAIETRTGVARAANTGFSLFVDPLGRSYGTTPLSDPAVRIGTVYTSDAETLYARWGDWLGTAVAAAALAMLLAALLASRPRWLIRPGASDILTG